MFPVKRRRGTSPSNAPTDYEHSMHRQHHVQREYGYANFSQHNRSVRGPSLAPTSRHDIETERRGRTAQQHQDANITRGDVGGARGSQFSRSWHEEPPVSWQNSPHGDDHDMDTEVMRSSSSSSSSLPGLSLLLQRRETVPPGRSEDALRRAQDMARSVRPRNSDTAASQAPHDQCRPVLTPLTGHTERFRSSVDSDASSPASIGMQDSIGSVHSDDLPIHPYLHDREPAGHASKGEYSRGRADSASSNGSMQSTASPSFGTPSPSGFPLARTMAKSSRYLREIDRRNILQRIKNGEKQSTLAKEYQVSRAAICNLNKHRDVVLSRKNENPLAKHPKKPRPKGDAIKNKPATKGVLDLTDVSAGVHEVRSHAASVLMTLLLDHQTSLADFKRSAYRLLRLLVEEAISLVPLKRIQVAFTNDAAIEGVEIAHPFCGVAMKVSGGGLLLQVFRELEPQRAIGSIRVSWNGAVDADLPPAVGEHNVFLFDLVLASSEATCLAVSSLVARGVKEETIWLVTLSVSVPVAEAVMTKFPNIKIVTAQMDRSGLHGDPTTRSASRDAIHCLIKRLFDTIAPPHNTPGPASDRANR